MKQVEAAKRAAILRSLTRRFHPDQEGPLLAHLRGEERLRTEGLDVPPLSSNEVMEPPLESLSPIHPSWLDEVLEKGQPNLQALYHTALDGEAPLSEPVRAHFLQQLATRLGMHAVVPAPALPNADLNVLLTLERRTLVLLTLYMGLRDLSQEMRSTIESDQLRAVQALLTKRQSHFIELCMRDTDPLSPPKLGLNAWSHSREELHRLAQQRGLIRLGRALAHSSRSLLWHVAHRLDTGRGRIVVRCAREEVSERLSEQLTDQLLRTLQLIGESP